jgi:hypothetical protein
MEKSAGHPFILPVTIVIVSFLLFAGGTAAYTTWFVNNSQHNWCNTINLLLAAPAPKAAPGNPSRTYDAKLATDFRVLKTRLGC